MIKQLSVLVLATCYSIAGLAATNEEIVKDALSPARPTPSDTMPLPKVVHGEMIDPAPKAQPREPTPIEKVYIESPVKPAVIDGGPGIKYETSTP